MHEHKAKVLAIIPARAGSKRVPDKNIRPFAGTSLTQLAIEQALQAACITDIVVTSDSTQVLQLAKKYARIIALERPAEYSTDESPAIEYIRHALKVVESNGKPYEIIVILQPSSPLRSASDIDKTVALLQANPDADSAVSVVKIEHMVHPIKMKLMKGQELIPFLEDEKGRFLTKDLPDVFVRNCAVYATWRKDLETRPDVIGKKSLGYIMPAETSVDINEMIDFRFAEFLWKTR